MTEAEFINNIQGELTVSGSLPKLVPDKEIRRIIMNAEDYFAENYITSVEPHIYIIKKENFKTDAWKADRTIDMPQCVISVNEVKEVTGESRLGNIDRDFSENRLIASEIFLSSFHGDDLVMRTAQYQYFDLAKAYFLQQITHDYNRNTKKLHILGKDPDFDVAVYTQIRIPIEKLYNDPYFRKYCIGQSKLSFGRLIRTYKYPLPGGVEIDGDSMASEGKEDIDWVLTKIDEENVPSWFLQYH